MAKIIDCCEKLRQILGVHRKDRIARDEVLINLKLLQDFFCSELSNVECSLFFGSFCKNGSIVETLYECLNSEDHFIAFGSWKVLAEIYKYFPNLVLCSRFEELIGLCLAENKHGRWLPVYTVEIMKELYLQVDSGDSIFREKNLEKQKYICCCVWDRKDGKPVPFKEITNAINWYWLRITSHFLAKLSSILNAETLLKSDILKSKHDLYELVLTTMLSFGKNVIESWDDFSSTQESSETSTYEIDSPKTSELDNVPFSFLNSDLSLSEMSKNAKVSKSYVLHGSFRSLCACTCKSLIKYKCMTKSFEANCNESCTFTADGRLKLFKNIVVQLVQIDHRNCSLHFTRTLFQFLNEIVTTSSRCCDGFEKTESSQHVIKEVSALLLKSSAKLFGSVPQVTGNVHFGGVSNEDNMDDQCYDNVTLRKVLLLVSKSALVTLNTQNDSSEVNPWPALKESLESWFNFVLKISDPGSPQVWLIQLFSDQDDELICLLFVLLEIYQKLYCCKSVHAIPFLTNHLRYSLNPHRLFAEFLKSINYDQSLLLDFLISNETHFLPYFLNYLRHLANDWYGFMEFVKGGQSEKVQPTSRVLAPEKTNCGRSIDLCNGFDNDTDDSNEVYIGTFDNKVCDGENRDRGCDGDIDDGSNLNIVSEDEAVDKADDGEVCGDFCFGEIGDENIDDDEIYDSEIDDDSDDNDVYEGGTNDRVYDTEICDICNDEIEDNSNPDQFVEGVIDDVVSEFDDSSNDEENCSKNDQMNSTCNDEIDYDTVDSGGENGQDVQCDTRNDDSNYYDDNLQQLLSCLIRLRFTIERMVSKDLFPYPVTALVRVMKYIETLYEKR